jgi:hypothetical protein
LRSVDAALVVAVQHDAGRCEVLLRHWALQCNATLELALLRRWVLQCNATLELALLRRWVLQCNATLELTLLRRCVHIAVTLGRYSSRCYGAMALQCNETLQLALLRCCGVVAYVVAALWR